MSKINFQLIFENNAMWSIPIYFFYNITFTKKEKRIFSFKTGRHVKSGPADYTCESVSPFTNFNKITSTRSHTPNEEEEYYNESTNIYLHTIENDPSFSQ